MVKLKKINNEIIVPIPVPKYDSKNVKGFNLFPIPYSNIFLCAKKNSGKTNVINKILDSCLGENTIVYLFCPTVNNDPCWTYIINEFKKNNVNYHIFYGIRENKIDVLDDIRKSLINYEIDDPEIKAENEKKSKEIKKKLILTIKDDVDGEIKHKKSKYKSKLLSPEVIFIFDDIGNELKASSVSQLLKTQRHYRARVIISSQNINDLAPQSRTQIDYWLLFGGHQHEKIITIRNDSGVPIDPLDLIQIYSFVTKDNYNFLYLARNGVFRKNFDIEIILED